MCNDTGQIYKVLCTSEYDIGCIFKNFGRVTSLKNDANKSPSTTTQDKKLKSTHSLLRTTGYQLQSTHS